MVYDANSHVTAVHHSLELKFSELVSIDKKRISLNKYTEKSNIHLLFMVAGTIWPHVIREPLLYITFAVYFVCRWIHIEEKEVFAVPSTATMSVLGSIISFLIVFFVQQSYTRYFAQHQICLTCQTRLMDAVTLSRGFIPVSQQWQMWRYLNAAHILGYVGISDVYNMQNFFEVLCARYGLLTEDELRYVHQFGAEGGVKASNELITWACDVAYTQRDAKLVPDLYVMQYIYLPLFAYFCANSLTLPQKGTSQELIGPLAIFINALFVIGLTGESCATMR
jgi:lipid-A-disaccharide synthase-like uncharacterized protein